MTPNPHRGRLIRGRLRRNVAVMQRLVVILLIALGLLVLAAAAWTVQGVRWALTGSRHRRPRTATA
jgi:uncharacterized membrane protein YidH (DUF202 family)